jgi:uncharacterized protein YbjQ (UPF0145 family)
MLTPKAHVVVWIMLLAVLGLGGCASRRADHAAPTAQPSAPRATAAYTGKVLILGGPLPADLRHEVVGHIGVFKRGFGGTGEAFHMLGDKARALGANAVIDARVWLAPAFPVNVAPHGRGIAVRVQDPTALEELGKTGGRWE